jgi:hypothetical protein
VLRNLCRQLLNGNGLSPADGDRRKALLALANVAASADAGPQLSGVILAAKRKEEEKCDDQQQEEVVSLKLEIFY